MAKQRGSVVVILVGIVALAGIGYIGWQAMSKHTGPNSTEVSGASCPEPFVLTQSPADISKVTTILYPGQTRGGHYKAHGGFGFAEGTNAGVNVVIPMDAKLVSGSRYIELGEVQYLFDFKTDCGVDYRFDHLLTLTDRFQSIANTLPEAKPDDSRGTNIAGTPKVTAGEVVATAVGFAKTGNTAFDFGVYDRRQQNEASKDTEFAKAHESEKDQAFYGVCWFDLLPAQDAAVIKALPSRDFQSGKTSDYCK